MGKNLYDKRIGQIRYNSHGEKMTCIKYIDSHNIIIEFNDEEKTVSKCAWKEFNQGKISNPSRKHNKLGQIRYNNQGEKMICVEYINSHHIVVEFDDKLKKKCTWRDFDKGMVKHPLSKHKKNNKFIGMKFITNEGYEIMIIKYINAHNVIAQFQDEHNAIVNVSFQQLQKGQIRNPYHKSVFGIGYLGEGNYPTSVNGKTSQEYITWKGMIERGYNIKYKENHPSYIDVTVCESWHNYSTFYEWIHSQDNYEKWLNGDRWALDKDILVKGNKIYSPQYCKLVPQRVNCFLIKRNADRGDFPIGVSFDKNKAKYTAYCSNPFTKKLDYLGAFETVEEAFQVYKNYKEMLAKQLAKDEYMIGNIDTDTYNALMNYQVEITD